MKRIISYAFKRLPQSKISTFTATVTSRMLNDDRFVAFKTDVNVLKGLNEAFVNALANAADGGRELTAIKSAAMQQVIDQLEDVALDVERFANGDKIIAMAAGFEVYAEPTPINVLLKPVGLTAINEPRTGAFKLSWESVDGAVNYGVEYQIVGETTWQNGTYSTKKDVVMTGFGVGTFLKLKVRALGRKGLASDFSEPTSIVVI